MWNDTRTSVQFRVIPRQRMLSCARPYTAEREPRCRCSASAMIFKRIKNRSKRKREKQGERERRQLTAVKTTPSIVDASSIDQEKNPAGHLRGIIVSCLFRPTFVLLIIQHQHQSERFACNENQLLGALIAIYPFVIFPRGKIALSKRRAEGCIKSTRKRRGGGGEDIKAIPP